MAVNEAKASFLTCQKRYTEAAAKKVKLEVRQAELREKLQALEEVCVENQAGKNKITQAYALGELSLAQYEKAVKVIVGMELERNQVAELAAAVSNCLVDADNSLTSLQRELNEAERKFYVAIAETLEAEIKTKIPAKDLAMLAFARLRAGRVQGADSWRNMLIDVCGSGRFTAEDLKATAAEINRVYGI